jgi:hypothetical protein
VPHRRERSPPARSLFPCSASQQPSARPEVRLFAARGRFAIGAKASSLAIEIPEGVLGGAAAYEVVLRLVPLHQILTGDRVPKVQLDKVTPSLAATSRRRRIAAVGHRVGEAVHGAI